MRAQQEKLGAGKEGGSPHTNCYYAHSHQSQISLLSCYQYSSLSEISQHDGCLGSKQSLCCKQDSDSEILGLVVWTEKIVINKRLHKVVSMLFVVHHFCTVGRNEHGSRSGPQSLFTKEWFCIQ